MELWVGSLNLGFLYAFMTMGVFITFRVYDFPDITVDGSFTTGAAVTAVLIVAGINPVLALLAACLVGAAAGSITALIHTRLKINGLLAGILVMTALYSINLHIMGRSNIPLLNETTILSYVEKINPGLPMEPWICLTLSLVMLLFWLIAALFFKTDLGISMRVTGNNSTMAAAAGVNVARMTIFGVALANALVAISGGLVAQYQGFADIGMGIGTIVIGLAAVIIGESIFRMRSMYAKALCVIVGSLLFRLMIAFALYAGMNPIDLKLLTAVFVLLTLIFMKTFGRGKHPKGTWAAALVRLLTARRFRFILGIALLAVAFALFAYRQFQAPPGGAAGKYKIGLLQISDHSLLNVTRDSFVAEMERIGYKRGENCEIRLKDANGDLPTVNTILDQFLYEKVDLVLSISTPCTQAAINKIKDRPVVFATVANPFIVGAGKSDADHLPNVTGVYGWAPMDKTMAMVREILHGPLKIGCIWDPAHANSVFNVSQLQKEIEADKEATFLGATVSNSSEVYQAALSLVQKGIDTFVLCPDNIVYSAFEGVVKTAQPKKIPIFISDVERLGDGAFGALGYDYTSSGIQAAHIVDRVLKGENPKDIPFQRYTELTLGFNLDAAKQLGITIPPDLLKKATLVHGGDAKTQTVRPPTPRPPAPPKRLALFRFSDHPMLVEAAEAVVDELRTSGILKEYNITVDQKNAQNEFFMAQSIAQQIVSEDYDYIVTLSTPILQVMAQANKKIPHVFGAVTDPYRMGVAKTPEDHLPNITGVATFQPVETTIQVMRELFPTAKRIGLVWNTAEACSEACTLKARPAAERYGFELCEANVSSTSEVLDALRSVLAREIDLFFTSGDNTVILALGTIAKTLKPRKIPYFTNDYSDVDRGAFLGIGADYREVGKETARMAIRVIKGEDPKNIPINNFVPEKMSVNLALAEEYGIDLPEEFLKKAAKVKR